MKHIIQLLLASIIMFGITACHTENDDYYSTVSIILSANDDMNEFIEWNVAELIKGNGKAK